MKIYAHRGNLDGPDKIHENSPEKIKEALAEKFYVEVDAWYVPEDDSLWFGHDFPTYKVDWDFIQQYKYQMVIHAKSFETLVYLKNRDCHHFFHDKDDYVLTSWNWIWMYPSMDNKYDWSTIMALPEQVNLFDKQHVEGIGGVCTDYPNNYT